MNVVYTIEVLHELRTARQWYNARAAGTGDRLIDLVDEKVGAIARAPASFPQDRHEPTVRRARLRKYPYTLLFMVQNEVVVVLVALVHGRRKPGYWKARLSVAPSK